MNKKVMLLRTNHYLKTLLLYLILIVSHQINAQDLHYSQFYNSPLNINPASTGIFNGDQRFTASVRDQWRYVPVPWFTFSGAYDFLLTQNADNNLIGLGINFNYDRQGDSRINLAGLNLSGSYSRILTKNHILSGGVTLGFATRGFDTKRLTWDKQWNGDSFVSGSPTGERFDAQRVAFLETAVGGNYRWQKSSRTKVDLGVGLFHLLRPSANFYDADDTKLPRRLTLSGVGNFKLLDRVDIQLHALHQFQGKYNETIFGGLGKLYLNQKRGKETQLHLGLGYRTSGSLFPTLAIEYNNFYVSMSYDIDNTGFNTITNSSRGGPEFHVRYIIQKVKPLKIRKVCPIY